MIIQIVPYSLKSANTKKWVLRVFIYIYTERERLANIKNISIVPSLIECSMSCRQGKMYKLQHTSKTYHYSLFHPKGIFRWWIHISILSLFKI